MRTFLAFMEDGWAWVVATDFFRVCVRLATTLMDALLGHVGGGGRAFLGTERVQFGGMGRDLAIRGERAAGCLTVDAWVF